jgi:hypothetical protein
MSIKLLFALTTVLVLSFGCGRAPSEPAASATSAPADANVARDDSADATKQLPQAVADTTNPGKVVAAFLDALRDGDDGVAEALLTSIARRETQAHELTVQPPGAPSARYEIGEVKPVQGGVHVYSNWTETDEAGEEFVYEIVWVLRQEPIGWRVAGMATALNPDQPPIYLNFEDVPDLLEKWRQADIELAAQAIRRHRGNSLRRPRGSRAKRV